MPHRFRDRQPAVDYAPPFRVIRPTLPPESGQTYGGAHSSVDGLYTRVGRTRFGPRPIERRYGSLHPDSILLENGDA